jgi:hypothetical protein
MLEFGLFQKPSRATNLDKMSASSIAFRKKIGVCKSLSLISNLREGQLAIQSNLISARDFCRLNFDKGNDSLFQRNAIYSLIKNLFLKSFPLLSFKRKMPLLC